MIRYSKGMAAAIQRYLQGRAALRRTGSSDFDSPIEPIAPVSAIRPIVPPQRTRGFDEGPDNDLGRA